MKSATPTFIAAEKLLKRTTSRCPVCHAPCPAEVWRVDGEPAARVFLRRTCPVHGEASVCIASDARFYWLAKGDPENENRCCGPGTACCASDGSAAGTLGRNANGRGEAPVETLATCLALIEIVHSCNLSCPTCYADSPAGKGERVDAVPLDDLKQRIQGVVDRKGGIEILQLSGGEPTLHPQFFELVAWLREHPGIDYVLLNTNGVRIANDRMFAERFREVARRSNFQLYLQFDGDQLAGQRFLRGTDLRELRRRTIEWCGAIHLPVTLAMTVTRENLSCLWSAVEFGLRYPCVRGISFQPMFLSGRVPAQSRVMSSDVRLNSNSSTGRAIDHRGQRPTQPESQSLKSESRLNTADLILALVEQSEARLRFEDFTPLPCGDPNCATIGYLLKVGGRTHSISDFIDFTQVQGFLRDKVRYRLDDLKRCGCESEPLGELLKRFELDESNTFRLFIKPFMDAWSWDEDRIDRCCTHVIRPDGRLDSFCRYYSGFPDTRPAL